MSVRFGILAVEGPADEATVGRALKHLSFQRLGGEGSADRLDPFWRPLVPTYPRKGDLYKRLDMPSIFTSSEWSIAVYAGEGSLLCDNLVSILDNHDRLRDGLAMLGVIADADRSDPADVARGYSERFRRAARDAEPGVGALFADFPSAPGSVSPGPPPKGIFVLPDNHRRGVLEHLLLECGEHVYPGLVTAARSYVATFPANERRSAKWAPFDEEKAIVASVASLLRPGKTNTTSIHDNRWIGAETAGLPMLAGLLGFLRLLLDGVKSE